MSSIDPIHLLRDHYTNKKPIKLKEKKLVFGRVKLPLSTPTNWKPRNSKKQYKLGDLWHFLNYHLNPEKNKSDYYKELSVLKKSIFGSIQIVSSIHQKEIKKYFSGEIEDSQDIDHSQNVIVTARQLRKRAAPSNDQINALTVRDTGDQQGRSTNKILKDMSSKMELEKHFKQLSDIRYWSYQLETKNSKLRKGKSFKWCIEIMKNPQMGSKEDQRMKLGNQTILEEIRNGNNFGESNPIILVPNAVLQGNLCLLNAKTFFKEGKFMKVSDRRTFDRSHDSFVKEISGQKVVFDVYDDIQLLRERKMIDRVVAIFLTDNPYQFRSSEKNFKERNIAKLLTKYRGFSMKFTDVKLNNEIKRWNIKVLNIKRNQRHQDIIVQREFWEDLTRFLNSKRR